MNNETSQKKLEYCTKLREDKIKHEIHKKRDASRKSQERV